MERFLRRRFLILLLALFLLLGISPLLRGVFAERVLFDALFSLVLVAALFAIVRRRSLLVPSLLLALPTLVGTWTGYALPGVREPVALFLHLSAAVFLLFMVAAILRAVYAEAGISADSVYGAFCGYLFLGVAFGHVFCIVEGVAPGSYSGGAELAAQLGDEDRRRFLLTYFSFITLTTVGYGDITPVKDAARGLAVVEAVAGQFYIAVLVAELIGKRVSQVLAGPPPTRKREDR